MSYAFKIVPSLEDTCELHRRGSGCSPLGDVRRNSPWLTTVGTPVIGAFAMTAWDLALDPGTATIRQAWIWEDGGGFFGVPLVNFLGWTFTVYLFMQVFALYLRSRAVAARSGPRQRQ